MSGRTELFSLFTKQYPSKNTQNYFECCFANSSKTLPLLLFMKRFPIANWLMPIHIADFIFYARTHTQTLIRTFLSQNPFDKRIDITTFYQQFIHHIR